MPSLSRKECKDLFTASAPFAHKRLSTKIPVQHVVFIQHAWIFAQSEQIKFLSFSELNCSLLVTSDLCRESSFPLFLWNCMEKDHLCVTKASFTGGDYCWEMDCPIYKLNTVSHITYIWHLLSNEQTQTHITVTTRQYATVKLVTLKYHDSNTSVHISARCKSLVWKHLNVAENRETRHG